MSEKLERRISEEDDLRGEIIVRLRSECCLANNGLKLIKLIN